MKLVYAVAGVLLLSACGAGEQEASCSNGYVPQSNLTESELEYVCVMRADSSPFKDLEGSDDQLIEVAENTCLWLEASNGDATKTAERLVVERGFTAREAAWLAVAASGYCLDNDDQV